MFDNQLIHIPKWYIKNHKDYYFSVDNKLINSKTNRTIKKCVKGGLSVGYTIDGKFITLKNLKPLIKKVKKLSKNLYNL